VPSHGLLSCETCEHEYPVVDGIPILLLDGATSLETTKSRQVEFFDEEGTAEFEVTRPHGEPALYRWLLLEKFRRSVIGLEPMLAGSTALTVCGGSGMDAEFLARAGASVIVSDIALGAARRAQERARRYELPITAIVADVEHLPFPDRAIDIVYVHDGLHHLERPFAGLAEMARVASRAVSVSEPARASITALAIRLGIAGEYEEAGNRVERLTIDEIQRELRSRGFRVLHEERYGMFYRHEPGRPMRWLSHEALFPLVKVGFRIANGVVGRFGNKLTVQSVRADGPSSN
jgi:ubiquinone/menaquinone biosynthesis C-methylase UbiE